MFQVKKSRVGRGRVTQSPSWWICLEAQFAWNRNSGSKNRHL